MLVKKIIDIADELIEKNVTKKTSEHNIKYVSKKFFYIADELIEKNVTKEKQVNITSSMLVKNS